MMKSMKWAWASSLAFIALVAMIPQAQANSWGLGGYAGSSQVSGFNNCWNETWGGVTFVQGNTGCGALINGTTYLGPWWEVAMPVASTGGTYTPVLYVSGTSTNPIACGVDSCTENQSTITTTTVQEETSGSGSLSFSLNVPSTGYMFAACQFGENAKWYSATW